MKKRLLSILLMCCMVLLLLPMTVFAGGGEETPAPEPIEWERSKSKTATQLDGNFESKVTISLPSAQAICDRMLCWYWTNPPVQYWKIRHCRY